VTPALLVVLLLAADPPRPCPVLARDQAEKTDAVDRLARWMDTHCPGRLEVTEPFCRRQSTQLLERAAEVGEVAAERRARGCRG
jgi:hypothetical protein